MEGAGRRDRRKAPEMTRKTQTNDHRTHQFSPAEALTLLEETLSYFTPATPVATKSEAKAAEYVPYAA
ncbi:hypothetical protein DL237_07085 [Pseudooceanicola sediminis]|uniref:Uncharacterized protein n=2 Tax=Pseudooceanicola sediminis TaxID=2211117 RepID=A0A399J268_9RHOB|nr:hypothetical protein DL237_07085 [Pseudooceanicola sediminis]